MQLNILYYNQIDNLENNSTMNFILLVTFLFLITTVSYSQNYTVSINDSISLNPSIGISTIGKDLDGNFLLGFVNKQTRKYSSDFTSFVDMKINEVVESFEARETLFWMTLSNGTFLNVSDRKIVIKSNGLSKLGDYSYTNYNL